MNTEFEFIKINKKQIKNYSEQEQILIEIAFQLKRIADLKEEELDNK